MKKLAMIIIFLIMIIIFSVYLLFINYKGNFEVINNYNAQYEIYLNKIINGTELATLINKVTNTNEKNKIAKDKNNYYINDNRESIKIDIKILFTNKTYPMEEIYNANTAEFVKHFDLKKFKCNGIEYHKKTGKVSKILFEQIEEI